MNKTGVNNIIDANIKLVDENKLLKEDIKGLKSILEEIRYYITEGKFNNFEDYTYLEQDILTMIEEADKYGNSYK